jgi:methyl-accepting chemotaxis protein
MAALSAFIETSIVAMSIEEPRKRLEIYRLEDDKQTIEINLTKRLIFTNVGFVVFVMLVMVYVNMASSIRNSVYSDYLEYVIRGEKTVEQAAQEYRQEGSEMIHVPPEAIIFPLDATNGGKQYTKALGENILMFIVLFLIANVLQILTARETVKQITNVSGKLKEMLAGTGDLTQRVEITQYDEVGHLVSDLNLFMDSLQKTFIDVQKTSLMALGSASSLTKEIKETSGASEGLAGSVTQVAKNVEDNLKQVEMTARNLSEVFLALDHIISSVDSQATFVNQTSSAVTEMAANVKSVSDATIRANNLSIQLSKAAGEGNEAVTNSIHAIRKIEESSKKVTEMVSVISQIASQTNLLAMNAAIEAAHAGDAGKGFAVVANEVRSLAESSAKSAKEITVQIKKMLETVHNGVSLSETAGSSLSSISADISATAGLVKQIANAMTEQSLAANDILQSITNLVDETQSIKNNAIEQKRRNDVVRGSVDRNTESMREIAQVTKNQTEEARMILKSISDLKTIEAQNAEMAQKLASLVNGFKLL